MSQTVLLIDGEPLTEHLFSRALRLAGHSVMLASDTTEALENLDGDLPDAIVIHTNDLESAEDSRALRELIMGASVPIVMIGQTVSGTRLVNDGNVLFARSGDPSEVVGLVREALGTGVIAA